MIALKRTLLIILICITLSFIGYQLYLIMIPVLEVSSEKRYVHLVDQYHVLKMKRLVLEEQSALVKAKSNFIQVAKDNNQPFSFNKFAFNTNCYHVRKQLLPNTNTLHLNVSNAAPEPIALSIDQAKTFEQLEAYVSNSKPLQPKPPTTDEKALLSLSPNDFTLQLMGVRDPSELTNFIASNQLENAHIFHTFYLNKDWYVLVCGLYKNHTEALKAIETLPSHIKALKPWIRQISSVQKAIQFYRQ